MTHANLWKVETLNTRHFIQQINAVIEAAKAVQIETGPDTGHCNAAEADLRREKDLLILLFERAKQKGG